MVKRILFIGILTFKIVTLSRAARSMYVDGFSGILGNTTAENTLLQYAQDNEISTLLLYELHLIGLPSTTAQTELAAFISKAKTTYGISKVAATAENAWFLKTVLTAITMPVVRPMRSLTFTT